MIVNIVVNSPKREKPHPTYDIIERISRSVSDTTFWWTNVGTKWFLCLTISAKRRATVIEIS